MSQKRFFKDVVFFFSAILFAKCIGMATSFFTAKILNPGSYGLWTAMTLIVSYSGVAHLGTLESLAKQFPYYMGRGELRQARETENVVFGSILMAALLVSLVGIGPSFVGLHDSEGESMPLVQMMFATASAGLVSVFFSQRLIAHQHFKAASLLESSRAIATFLLLVIPSWRWGLAGTVVGYLVAEIVVGSASAWLSGRLCGPVHLSLDLKHMWRLVKIGFPITGFWWILILQTSVDRVVSIIMLGKEPTGYYGLGVALVSTIVLVPQSVSKVLYPRLSIDYGRNTDESALVDLVLAPTRILVILLPLLIGLLIIACPFIYKVVVPKYAPGLLAGQILLAGSFFRMAIGNGANFLIVTNRQNRLLWYVVVSILVGVGGAFLLVKLGSGIEGVAISTGASGFVLACLVWTSVFAAKGIPCKAQMKGVLRLFAPYLLLLSPIGIIALFFPQRLQTDTSQVAILNSVLFVMAFLFLVALNPTLRNTIVQTCVLIISGSGKSGRD